MREAVVLTERPSHLALDAQRRLHSETDAAIKYPDGWGVYAWHGVRVPERVILRPRELTASNALAERNAEIRRVMIERIGLERFLFESGARPLHQDEVGSLYRITVQNDEPLAFVHVTNATPEPDGSLRKYVLRVPPDMQRAREAVAWTFAVPEGEYAPKMET